MSNTMCMGECFVLEFSPLQSHTVCLGSCINIQAFHHFTSSTDKSRWRPEYNMRPPLPVMLIIPVCFLRISQILWSDLLDKINKWFSWKCNAIPDLSTYKGHVRKSVVRKTCLKKVSLYSRKFPFFLMNV